MVVYMFILYSAVVVICPILTGENAMKSQTVAEKKEEISIEQEAGGDIVGRDKINVGGDFIITTPGIASKDSASQTEIAKVKINRAFEDYDSDIPKLLRSFEDSSEQLFSYFSKRGMLRSGGFIGAQMDLSRETKDKVHQRLIELKRCIQDILIERFGKTSLSALGEEFEEQLRHLNDREAQARNTYIRLETYVKDLEMNVIGELRTSKGFRLTDDP